jgi:hypothetical protein
VPAFFSVGLSTIGNIDKQSGHQINYFLWIDVTPKIGEELIKKFKLQEIV